MNRTLDFLRGRLAGPPDATDRSLLDGFLAGGDEAAFAEVVRRHGPLVWGVCRRRLGNTHDAEDAFQAAFLVLVRRAAGLPPDVPLGPWLHRVAVLTARNVRRGNRRRAAVSAPLEFDAPSPRPADADIDIDAALLALPERERAAVVLCHLQGFTRKEAAARLGCPEGTLSARLSRALGRLRVKLAPAAVAVPVGLSAATVRAATVSVTSSLAAAGVCPAVAGLTNGVLRMFWVKNLVAAGAFAALLGGGLLVGLASDPAAGPPAAAPLATQPDDPAAEAKKLAEKIDRLKTEQAAAEAALQQLTEAERRKRVAAAKREKEKAPAAKLPTDLLVEVPADADKPFTIWEVIEGRVGELHCRDIDVLRTYLERSRSYWNGPKTISLAVSHAATQERLTAVLRACASAGFRTATVAKAAPPWAANVEWVAKPKPEEVNLDRYSFWWPW